MAARRKSQALAALDDPREQRFVELYVETNNATRSALAAGYGRNLNTAGNLGHHLLKRPKIRDAVERRNAEIMIRYDFTPDRIIRELAKLAGANVDDILAVDEAGKLSIDLTTVHRDQLAAVQAIEIGENGPKVRLADKHKALVELAKLARMYPAERTEVTGADGGPLTSVSLNATQHKIDIEALEPDQREQLRQTLLMLQRQRNNQDDED